MKARLKSWNGNRMEGRCWLWAWTFLLTCLPTVGNADESYYLLIFGSQRPGIKQPRHAHSFATFVKVIGTDVGRVPLHVERFTISWLPVVGEVHCKRLTAEAGRNFDLHETLALAVEDRQRISLWGPYRIQPELYERAARRKAYLDSGAVRYKAVDTGYPPAKVSNCIHALSDIVFKPPRPRVGTLCCGECASYFLALTFEPWIIDPCQTHDWIGDLLGLGGYPIIRREFSRNPTPGPLLRCLRTAYYRLLIWTVPKQEGCPTEFP